MMWSMIIVKATEDSEAGVIPEEGLFAEMADEPEGPAGAGALLGFASGEALDAPSRSRRSGGGS